MSIYDRGKNVPVNLNLSELQAKLSTTATLGTEESGRCGEMAVMGRWGEGCNMTPAVLFSFLGAGGGGVGGVQHVYFPGPCLLYPTMAIQS